MDVTVASKLQDLWKLQLIDTQIDNLRALLGDLPFEVADLEDEIAGLETRTEKIGTEMKAFSEEITGKKTQIKEFNTLIAKYEDQLKNIKNSREFEALEKEKEIAGLEILSAEKKIRDYEKQLELKKELHDKTNEVLESRQKDLEFKRGELSDIEKESEDEMSKLQKQREKTAAGIESRLGRAYSRIRANMRNGIAIAPIIKNSCGGCFSKFPPQRLSDIRAHFRIIDCENCGRILADAAITGIESESLILEEKPTRRKLKLSTK